MDGSYVSQRGREMIRKASEENMVQAEGHHVCPLSWMASGKGKLITATLNCHRSTIRSSQEGAWEEQNMKMERLVPILPEANRYSKKELPGHI